MSLLLWWLLGDFALILYIRYVWNTWHGVAQHSGIARIYSLRAEAGQKNPSRWDPKWEKVFFRLFMLIVFMRLGGLVATYGDRNSLLGWTRALVFTSNRFDPLAMLIPVALLTRELARFERRRIGRFVYVLSICLNFSAMLACAHWGWEICAGALVMANAISHGTEYLAVSSWAMQKRSPQNQASLFAKILRQWPAMLCFFVCYMAIVGWQMNSHYAKTWLVLSTFVALLHYCYDGIIWKMPYVFPNRTAPNRVSIPSEHPPERFALLPRLLNVF